MGEACGADGKGEYWGDEKPGEDTRPGVSSGVRLRWRYGVGRLGVRLGLRKLSDGPGV